MVIPAKTGLASNPALTNVNQATINARALRDAPAVTETRSALPGVHIKNAMINVFIAATENATRCAERIR
jgi:hypothetical protein